SAILPNVQTGFYLVLVLRKGHAQIGMGGDREHENGAGSTKTTARIPVRICLGVGCHFVLLHLDQVFPDRFQITREQEVNTNSKIRAPLRKPASSSRPYIEPKVK